MESIDDILEGITPPDPLPTHIFHTFYKDYVDLTGKRGANNILYMAKYLFRTGRIDKSTFKGLKIMAKSNNLKDHNLALTIIQTV